MKKRCGNCKTRKRCGVDFMTRIPVYSCDAKMSNAVTHTRFVHDIDGTGCPCWKPRKGKGEGE